MSTVTLIGHLDADPVSRLMGKEPVVRLRLAVENRCDRTPILDSIDVWGNQGAAVARYLIQGRLVGVVGRLRSSLWRDGVSNRRQHFLVIAHAVGFLDKPARNGAASA